MTAEDAPQIDLDELQAARQDPTVKKFLGEAAAEGAKVKAEGRNVWEIEGSYDLPDEYHEQ